MAYVKITGEFIDRVKQQIARMQRDAQRQLEYEEIKTGSPEWEVMLQIGMSQIWGEYLHLKDQLPSKWKGESDTIDFNFANQEGYQFYSMSIDVVEDRGFPPGMSRWQSPDINLTIGEDVPDALMPWLDRIIETSTKLDECNEKFQTIKSQIVNFLKKHVSLNTAIKELPELELYIADSDMERLHRKVERAASTPAGVGEPEDYIGLDTDLLTSTAIASRIQGAKK